MLPRLSKAESGKGGRKDGTVRTFRLNVSDNQNPVRQRYLSTSVIANRLGISTRTVCLWAECGELPAVKFGRQWRFEETAFARWVSEQHANSGSQLQPDRSL